MSAAPSETVGLYCPGCGCQVSRPDMACPCGYAARDGRRRPLRDGLRRASGVAVIAVGLLAYLVALAAATIWRWLR